MDLVGLVEQLTESHAKSVVVNGMNKSQFLSSLAGKAIDTYQALYRHPNQPSFEIGKVVHLHPAQTRKHEEDGSSPWSDPWPFDKRAGVYFIFSEDHQILYIGKTSMGQCLGKRLYCHFGGGTACEYDVAGWGTEPYFVVNIAVPHESPFEAPALEEYLIADLSPKLNVHGI